MGWRLDLYNSFYKMLDVNIISQDYRGYGDSTGVPTEEGLKRDAEAL